MNDNDDLPVPEVPDSPAAQRPRRRRAAQAPSVEGVAGEPATANAASAEAPAQDSTSDGLDSAGAPGASGADGDAGAPARARRKRRRGRKGRGDRAPGQAATLATEQSQGPAQALAPVPDTGELFATVTAGEFDLQSEPPAQDIQAAQADTPTEDSAEVSPERRILAPDADAPKLQKVLAQSGLGSRRDLEQMIVDGRVSVNDEPAHVGQRVSWGDRVAIDGKPVKVRIAPLPTRVLAYHKPVGEVVTLDDPEGRPTVFRKLPRLMHGKW